MTYTAVNPHACCNWPRPEDAHAAARPPPHPTHRPTSPTTTDCAGRLMAGRQQTAPPQQRRSKDATAHPHQPGARPEPPHPDPAHSRRHHPAKAEVKFPLLNRIFKISQHIRIGPEPVLTAHARSPPAAGSHRLAGADSAPHSEQNFHYTMIISLSIYTT